MSLAVLDQGELFEIPNPCIGICTTNNKGYCKGCLRSRQERFHWNDFTPNQRQLVINLCEKRRQKILAAKHPKAVEAAVPEYALQKELFAEPPIDISAAAESATAIVKEEPALPLEPPAAIKPASTEVQPESTQPQSSTTGDQLGLF